MKARKGQTLPNIMDSCRAKVEETQGAKSWMNPQKRWWCWGMGGKIEGKIPGLMSTWHLYHNITRVYRGCWKSKTRKRAALYQVLCPVWPHLLLPKMEITHVTLPYHSDQKEQQILELHPNKMALQARLFPPHKQPGILKPFWWTNVWVTKSWNEHGKMWPIQEVSPKIFFLRKYGPSAYSSNIL